MPKEVWILGFVSLLMDVSSEMIHSLLPLFMVGSLGTSVFTVGLIEGAAEATALIIKIFSGALSDYLGKRKGLALLGYGLAAVTKPIFALAQGSGMVFFARITDRMGKGLRGAPRDALIADVTPAAMRGAAFGLRQSLDTIGAFLGPLLATLLMLLWANDFRAVFWVSVIPATLAVILLFIGIREPAKPLTDKRRNPIRMENLRRLPSSYWWVVAIGAIFTLARFSEAFLVLRAQDRGIALAWVPLVMVVMNIIYAATAYPFGKLSDRMEPVSLLALGTVVLLLADVVLALGATGMAIMLGIALWGLHLGITQGLMSALIAHTAPADLRGTAFGFFNLVSGAAMLLSSGLAGLFWDMLGPASTFWTVAGFCVLSLLSLIKVYSIDFKKVS
jgi:MFS family permease